MDIIENILFQCAALSFKVCLSYVLYEQYRKNAECLTSLKEAQYLELNEELKKTVEKKNGIIKYAAISGKIQALTAPLTSHYLPHLKGVICDKTTLGYKVKWDPVLGAWDSGDTEILESVNCIPFSLYAKSTKSLFKKISVEVIEPLTAEELVMPVYDVIISCNNFKGDAVFNGIEGEKLMGLINLEKWLCENETLTAVGKLVIENNNLKIKPPDEGLTYFLTPLSLETLIDEVEYTTNVYKVTTIIMSTLSLALFLYLSRRAFRKMKQKWFCYRLRKQLEKQGKIPRRKAEKSNKGNNVPRCIICSVNPIQILILECGHAYLCADCSEYIQNLCPVCRSPVTRTVSAFLP